MSRLALQLLQCPTQRLLLECPVCTQYFDPQDRTEVNVALFGANRYGVCCGCNQEVWGPPFGRQYKVRWGRRYRQLLGEKARKGRSGGQQEAEVES